MQLSTSSPKFFSQANALDLADFLVWLRDFSNTKWAIHEQTPLETLFAQGIIRPDWQTHTRWIGGFSDLDISAFESFFDITFPSDYRLFLSLLGAPDRHWLQVKWRDQKMVQVASPSFYNWKHDIEELHNRLRRPIDDILAQVDLGLWVTNWGERSDNAASRRDKVSALATAAPKLIPIIGHRYITPVPGRDSSVILSIVQRDVIIYGMDLKRFLLLELAELLGLNHNRAYANAVDSYNEATVRSIPFWGDIVLGEYTFVADE